MSEAAPKRSLLQQMGMPALAGGIAVCFSHPLELTKVRLQLDNERGLRGEPRMYRGWLDCVRQNFRAEGVRGLQRGLSLGITREVAFNAVRIGLLDTVVEKVHASAAAAGLTAPDAPPGGTERLLSGLTCGALGGCCVNPIEVLKTRFQAHGGLSGFQHRCRPYTPCMCHAYTMHVCRAYAMHVPCMCYAYTMHVPCMCCVRHAYAVHCHACAVHVPGTKARSPRSSSSRAPRVPRACCEASRCPRCAASSAPARRSSRTPSVSAPRSRAAPTAARRRRTCAAPSPP